jgi:hypothetical protein
MRRRVIGAALTILGLLLVLFEPVIVVVGCGDCVAGSNDPRCGCHEQGASDWWGLINYPPRVGQAGHPDVDRRSRARGDRDRPLGQGQAIGLAKSCQLTRTQRLIQGSAPQAARLARSGLA